MKYILSYSFRETCRRKGYYIVCLFACFLVALVALVSKTIISQASLIFLMISEQEIGQIDVELTPHPIEHYHKISLDDLMIDHSFFNFTAIKATVNKHISSTTTIRINYPGMDNNRTNRIELIVMNSTQEKLMGLGREFPNITMRKGECIAHSFVYKQLNKNIPTDNTTDTTDNIHFHLYMQSFLNNAIIPLINRSNEKESKRLFDLLNVSFYSIPLHCRVINKINSNYGKIKESYTNTVYMELEYFYDYIMQFIPNEITDAIPHLIDVLKHINPNDYGNSIIANFPHNRLSSYLEDDYDNLLNKGVQYGNALLKSMNTLKGVDVYMPIIEKMQYFNYGIVFINMILNMIVLSLFMLSLVFIYSLLSITMETNTFEFAILRLIGNTKGQIIAIILLQCFSFSIPAYTLAYVSHLQVIKLFNVIMKQFVKSEMSISNNYHSLIYSLIINFLAPLLSSIIPIVNILRKNIASSLNASMNKTTGMKIEIISVEKKDNETMVVFGILTFIYGASIYYFLPLSLISLNLALLGSIFLAILIGILLGLGIISLNLEHLIQRLFTNVFCCCYRKYMKQLIIKNLSAHRIKNRKSSLMITMSISVLIMVSVTLDIVIQAVESGKVQKNGDKFLMKTSFYTHFNHLHTGMKELFEKNLIKGFTLKSKRLSEICTDTQATIENIGNSFSSKTQIIAVSPNYFEVTDTTFLYVIESKGVNHDYEISHQLYTKDAYDKIGISGFYSWKHGTDINDNYKLTFTNEKTFYSLVIKPAFTLKAAPGLKVTDEPILKHFPRDTIVSIPTFIDLINKCKMHFDDHQYKYMPNFSYHYFPIDTIYFDPIVPSNSTVRSIEKAITAIMTKEHMLSTWSYEEEIKTLNNITELVFKIFNYITVVILFFCFFNLAASMSINIFEQKKEIAIIRSIGMTSYQVILVYIGEASVHILTSSFLGIAIGSLVSYTMSIQFQMFTHVTVAYQVRVVNLIIVLSFAIIGGILSTLIPAKRMMLLPIAQLIRES